MTKERKLSFAEGMAKLSKAHLEKKRIEEKEDFSATAKDKKKSKTKKNFADFIWISKYKKPKNINFNLKRNELKECFTIESYSLSSDNTKTRFLLSGFTLRRPWLLWKEEWDSDKEKFVNLQSILGLSKSDTKDSEQAIIELFKNYVNRIGYKIQANYIEDSLLISENKILKIIEAF
jgi:hypothetical protein